jgi:hypothetical protein
MSNLNDGQSTKSPKKVTGVKITGMTGQNYGQSNNAVTIKVGNDYKDPVRDVRENTSVTRNEGRGNYSITNNTGGIIIYSWIS